MLWYTVKDGKIHRIQCGESPTEGADWRKAPDDWQGEIGDKLEWFDDKLNRISDVELIKRGIRSDNRGTWFNKETKERKQIFNMDEAIDKDIWTKELPLENEAYQIFDNKKNKWVVDTAKKELADKKSRLGQLKAEVADAEQRQIRPFKAIFKNEASDIDRETFDKYEAIIQKLRPQISTLEQELESA